MQYFSFVLAHIPGRRNMMADYLSRIPSFKEDQSPETLEVSSSDTASLTAITSPEFSPEISRILSQVHGGRFGHYGARRTWLRLNDMYSGHAIPFRTVADFITACAVHQKTRLKIETNIPPLVRTIHPNQINE
jgi:hypothetical protein